MPHTEINILTQKELNFNCEAGTYYPNCDRIEVGLGA